MDNVVGVVAGDEIGFAYWLDRRYKGKGDDVSAPFYLYQGGLGDFRNLCKALNIAIVEYPTCAYCYKPIFGSFGFYEICGRVAYGASCLKIKMRKPWSGEPKKKSIYVFL